MKSGLKRVISLLLCAVLLVSNVPVTVGAAQCEHHTDHTADCGYRAGSEEVPCGHSCGDECYVTNTSCVHSEHSGCSYAPATEEAEEVPCDHVCSADSGCVTTSHSCTHTDHDEACGYQKAVKAAQCQYVCAECAAAAQAEEILEIAEVIEEAPQPEPEPKTDDLILEEAEVTDEAKNETPEPVEYNISVNGTTVTSENSNAVGGNAGVTYNDAAKTLTLDGVEVRTIETTMTDSLTILLKDGTKNKVTTFVHVNGDLIIKSESNDNDAGNAYIHIRSLNTKIVVDSEGGALTVENAAVEIDDSNQSIAAVVTGKPVTLLGTAHLLVKADEMAICDRGYVADGQLIQGEKLYYRTAEDAGFEYAEFEKDDDDQLIGGVTPDGAYLEVVCAEHVDTENYQNDETHHFYVCQKLGDDVCPTTSEAEFRKEVHDKQLTATENAHQNKCGVCKAWLGEETAHTLNYTESGNTITVTCADNCGAEGKLVLTAPNMEYTGAGYTSEDYEATGILEGDYAVEFYQGENKLTSIPVVIGDYTAKITIPAGKTASKDFKITKIDLANAVVTLDSVEFTYELENNKDTGIERKPTVSVVGAKGYALTEDDYSVEYKDNTEAGTATVVITAKPDSALCENSKTVTFTIKQSDAYSEEDFEFKAPEPLAYDAAEKTASITKLATVLKALGAATAIYCDADGDPIVDEAGQPVTFVKNVGTYIVKAQVAESKNYTGKTLENEAWTFTITPADYKKTVTEKQSLALGTGAFAEPVFQGVTLADGTAETVPGEIRYTLDDVSGTYEVISAKLAEEDTPGNVEIGYTFTPTVGGNYEAKDNTVNSGTITVTLLGIRFYVGDNEVSAENPAATVTENAPYGTEEPVKLKALKAVVGEGEDAKETSEGFRVVYTQNGEPVAKGSDLAVGNYDYQILFSGTVAEIGFTDRVVEEGSGVIAKAEIPAGAVTAPKGLETTTDGTTETALVTAGSVKDNVGTMVYSLSETGEYKSDIPKSAKAGGYTIWYKVVGDANHQDTEPKSVTAALLPGGLKAKYDDNLSSVELPEGFAWNYNDTTLATMKVGNVGSNKFKVTFKAPEDSGMTNLTSRDVTVKVEPKEIKVTVALKDGTHYKYQGTSTTPVERKPAITVTWADAARSGNTLASTEYTVSYTDNKYPTTKAKVTIASKTGGNYTFSDDSTTSAEFTIYRPGPYKLSLVPNTLSSKYATVDALKAALTAGMSSGYAGTENTYYNIKMQEYSETNKTWGASDNEDYCPEDGFTFKIAYPAGTTKATHDFKAVGISTMSKDTNPAVKAVTIVEDDDGIEFQMDGYAAVYLGWQQVAKDVYSVTAETSSYGTVKFSVGNSTAQKTSAEVAEGETVTVTVTPKTGYKVSKLQYIYKENGKTWGATISQNSDGDYTFKMPAREISLRATFEESAGTSGSSDTKDDGTATSYKVTAATSSYGTVKFSVGSSKTQKTSATVDVGETITVTVTPKTNYAVSKVQYTYKDGLKTMAATIKQNDDGDYTFKMPSKDITIKATFAKKTSTTKNPYTGDSSHIYLWTALMGISALGAVALISQRKRRWSK